MKLRNITLGALALAALGCGSSKETAGIEKIVNRAVVRQNKTTQFGILLCPDGYHIEWQYEGTRYVYIDSKSANHEMILIGKIIPRPDGMGGTPSEKSAILMDNGKDGTVDSLTYYMSTITKNMAEYNNAFKNADKILELWKKKMSGVIKKAEKEWADYNKNQSD